MKKIFLAVAISISFISCNKIEEMISSIASDSKQKLEQKTQEIVKETVNEQLNKILNAENVKFDSVFPNQNNLVIENEVGKKVAFPNGTPFYVFKFKNTNKELLLKTLVEQPTTNEAQSLKEFQKVDGASIIEKITFFEKFLPANIIDAGFIKNIKTDKTIEYYKIKRFPNSSTVIYNPKTQMVYQFVEVKR